MRSTRVILESQNHALEHPVASVSAVSTMEEIISHQQGILAVHVSDEIRQYILTITAATRKSSALRLGVSPRGSLALFRGGQALAALRGRDFVIPEDIAALLLPVLAKRIILTPEQQLKGITEQAAIQQIADDIEVPLPRRSQREREQ